MIIINNLESILAKEYCSDNVYFTGNGTTALYLIFKALKMQDKKVLYPDITCMAPVNAAIYAGYDVAFADVSKYDFNMDISSLKKVIENENIGIVVATHIYGHICDMKSIYEICKERNIVVVEDCAQTTYISKHNDFAITSFGHTKQLQTLTGGGAIFYKDKLLKEEFDKYSCDLSDKSNSDDFYQYREKYYKITKEVTGEEYYSQMKKLQIESKNIFLRHFKENDELITILKDKENIIFERNKRIELYKDNLNHSKFVYPKINRKPDTTLWRLSVLTKDIDRDRLVDLVREQEVDISTWYPCLHRFYSNKKDSEFANAVHIEKSIINLWITEDYLEEKIMHDIERINCLILREFS